MTDTDLVLLDAEGRRLKGQVERLASEGEWVAKIPRAEVTGVRLLDEHGEPVSVPPTELEELEHPDRLYTVWVDRRTNGDTGSHVFVFHAWSTGDEARRDFERALASTP